jgi:hypothetical protein
MHKDLSIQARKHRTSEIDDDTVNMMGYHGIYDQSKSRNKQTNDEARGYHSKQKVENKKSVGVQRRRGLELYCSASVASGDWGRGI